MPANALMVRQRVHQFYVDNASANDLYSYAAMRLVYNNTALASQTKEKYLLGTSRGRVPLARARQIAQYLLHVGFSVNFTEISHLVNRDRTSIAYACETIEDLRDDQKIDKALYFAEIALTEMMQNIWKDNERPSSKYKRENTK